MKDKKRRYETFSFYDFTGIAAHLTKMAEKGWLLESISNFWWTYRRIEPKKLTFSVCYYPKASQFDPEPSEEQKMFHEFCEHTGWVLAAASAQMQVFYNERENPTPIETDPVLEVETLHISAKKSFLPANILLTVIGVMQLALFWSRLRRDVIGVLSSATNLFTGVCWVAMLFLCVMELASYYLWHARAKKAAALGVLSDSPSREKMQKLILGLVILGFIYWQRSIFTTGTRMLRTVSILMLLYMIALFAAANWIKSALKRAKASRGVNRTVTFITIAVLSFTMTGAITYGTLRASQRGVFGDSYDFETEPPLTMEDLMDISNEGYIRSRTMDESLLLGCFNLRQFPREPKWSMPELEYTIIEVKLPSLYGLCKQSLIDGQKDDVENGQVVFCNHYEPADPAPWGAREAYRLYRSSGYLHHYLLCYEDRIVRIIFYWEPTAEQMTIVRGKLSS